jgi:phosphoglycerate dehydrogenase-like enzyme
MSFKIGVTRGLLTARGEPCFNPAAFEVLNANKDIAWEWIPEDLREITPDVAARYDGLLVNLSRVTRASVARADCRLKIVARNGVGFDTVDVPALTKKGIVLTNTPLAVRRPVAVAALTMIFALAGRLVEKDALVRAGRWSDRTEYLGVGLTTRTLGLVGAGGIGQEIMRLAKPFFARIIAADPYADRAAVAALGAEIAPLEAVMSEADFVVVCCLLNEETRHLIDARALALMKPTAFFINMARGPIHDEGALIDALRAGRIAGAGLDVTEVEPIQPNNPLLEMTNTIITPHALCATDECFQDIATTALQSIADFSLGRRPKHVVNPEAWDRRGPCRPSQP